MTQTSEKTVTVRIPEKVWRRIRLRALQRQEAAGAWLARCAEVCLGVAESGVAVGSVTRAAVEPEPAAVIDKGRSNVQPVMGSDAGPTRCQCTHIQTMHRNGTGKCEFRGCECMRFHAATDEERG